MTKIIETETIINQNANEVAKQLKVVKQCSKIN